MSGDTMVISRLWNVFVVGLDNFNLRLLNKVREPQRYRFHWLLDIDSIVEAKHFDMDSLLGRAREQLDEFEGSVDAIVGYWDFPTVATMAILRKEYGLHGPSLESVLRCDHKYWSRLVQREVVPEVVPAFAAVDPFDESSGGYPGPPLEFPFWLKPFKAHSSLLGFRIDNQRVFERAIQKTRAEIKRFAEPLEFILRHAELPEKIESLGAWGCIAEQIISKGRQCTLEGYVFQKEVAIYGIIDSLSGENRSSFYAYQYPSSIEESVQERMRELTKKVIEHVGLNDSPFNIEFYYDEQDESLYLLEINARISKSHTPLFNKVEGVPHTEVMLAVALGKKPDYPVRNGPFACSAKFMPRIYNFDERDVVETAPDDEAIQLIEDSHPGVRIQSHVRPGMTLGEVYEHDSYSCEVAAIFIGAMDHQQLHEKYRSVLKSMNVQLRSGALIE